MSDYGVIVTVIDAELCEYAVDAAATAAERASIRTQRPAWLATDPEVVAAAYRAGTLDQLDVVRRYAVLLEWDSGTLLTESTRQFREMFCRRTAGQWIETAA